MNLQAVGCSAWLGGLLCDATLYQLPHQVRGQGAFGWKTNRALTDSVSLEVIFVDSDRVSTRIERAVILGRTERYQKFPTEAEPWDVIADALFSRRRSCSNRAPNFLKRESLFVTKTCQVVVNILWFTCHSFCLPGA
jgi:hypothetical protein